MTPEFSKDLNEQLVVFLNVNNRNEVNKKHLKK